MSAVGRGGAGLPVVRARGHAGELRVGYQRAARLGAWELALTAPDPARRGEATQAVFRLRAAVAERHAYWMTQGPFTLVLALGRTAWVFRAVAVAADAAEVLVDLTQRPEVEPLGHGSMEGEQ